MGSLLISQGAASHALDNWFGRLVPDCTAAGILEQTEANWQSGDISGAISLTREAALTRCDQCDGRCSLYGRLQQALCLSSIRRIETARAVMSRISPATAGHDGPDIAAIMTLVGAYIALITGDLAAAADQSESGLRLAGEAGMVAWTPLGNFVLATTALRRGELSTALHYADRLKEDAVFGRKMLPVAQAAWVVAQITEVEKGCEQAAGLARELLGSESATRSLLATDPAAIPGLIRLMVNSRQLGAASRGVSLAVRLAAENPYAASARTSALHATGILEMDPGHLSQAAREHVDPWARASAFEDLAETLSREGGQIADAAETFRLALLSYADMGAHHDLSRVRSRLRRIDHKAPAAAGGWPPSHIPGLTDTEYAVAKLVASGLTNEEAARQMFLSRHTVAFHLRKIFRKLSLKSRLELAIMWNALDGDPTREQEDTRPAAGPDGSRRCRPPR